MIRHLGLADYRVMPWKNGLGSTTEIVRRPENGEFDFRVSIADVTEDGPFSRFDGIERIIMTIEGAGMRLTHAGATVTLQQFEPYQFAGELDTYCSLLSGAVRDFNVMTRRDSCQARVVVHRSSFEARATLLYCAVGDAAVEANGMQFRLRAGETLLMDSDIVIRAELSRDAVVIAVSVTTG
jgi:uncharacterized protein